MTGWSTERLVDDAARNLQPRKLVSGKLAGDVAATLIGIDGKAYNGICVDLSTWGFCAERAALAQAMLEGVDRFVDMVAVWRDPDTRNLHILPPCGHCREVLREVHADNLVMRVHLAHDRVLTLADLLPEHEWPGPYRPA